MKKTILFLFLCFACSISAQKVSLQKGSVVDNLKVHDTIPESFSLYLPSNFDVAKKWPVVFLFDMQGRSKQIVSMFRQAAEEQGYILAASDNVRDSLSLSKNILIANRLLNKVYTLLPISKGRSYTGGFAGGARMASLIPTFIKEVQGVISCGAPVANEEVLSTKNRFEFIGIVGVEDYNYLPMLNAQKLLNRLKFQNQLLVFDGGHKWPNTSYLSKALEILSLTAMARNIEDKDEDFINSSYQRNIGDLSKFVKQEQALMAGKLLSQITSVYKDLKDIDSLKESEKTLKKSKLYKTKNRSENAAFFKENFIKDEYSYLLEEDVLTYNYNNLGWWAYQMDELVKFEKSNSIYEQQMGKRLRGYVNALVADHIDAYSVVTPVDEEALTFLWMVKTITDAKNPKPYLKVISNSSKVEDYGTALFYLEELLKTGYSNKDELYSLEHTALLRLTPEFNKVVAKYLKEARYDVIINED